MRLRRFTGPTAAVVLRDVRRALGDDALILGTREVPGGGVEITAATDVDRVVRPLPEEPPPAATALAVDSRRLEAMDDLLRGFGAQLRRIDRMLRTTRGEGGRVALPAEVPTDEAREVLGQLVATGLPEILAERVAADFASQRAGGEAFDRALARGLAGCVPLAEDDAATTNVRFLVGPTGSGKTTTIAKLAADDVLAGRPRPVLLMGDTVRVGAAEQLGAFARLLGVRMYTVDGAETLRRHLGEVPEGTTVYVDTAGLSSDPKIARSLRELVTACEGRASVTAVVSAAAAASSLRRVWTQIEDLAPEGGAVTHVDESDEPGVACSWLAEVGLPLRWLGTGQRVPDDLVRASGENLALWLLAA